MQDNVIPVEIVTFTSDVRQVNGQHSLQLSKFSWEVVLDMDTSGCYNIVLGFDALSVNGGTNVIIGRVAISAIQSGAAAVLIIFL